jgi:hypothetical protein
MEDLSLLAGQVDLYSGSLVIREIHALYRGIHYTASRDDVTYIITELYNLRHDGRPYFVRRDVSEDITLNLVTVNLLISEYEG